MVNLFKVSSGNKRFEVRNQRVNSLFVLAYCCRNIRHSLRSSLESRSRSVVNLTISCNCIWNRRVWPLLISLLMSLSRKQIGFEENICVPSNRRLSLWLTSSSSDAINRIAFQAPTNRRLDGWVSRGLRMPGLSLFNDQSDAIRWTVVFTIERQRFESSLFKLRNSRFYLYVL